jgi:hypothetical protein
LASNAAAAADPIGQAIAVRPVAVVELTHYPGRLAGLRFLRIEFLKLWKNSAAMSCQFEIYCALAMC